MDELYAFARKHERCVNSHDELLAACRNAHDLLHSRFASSFDDNGRHATATMNELRSAIAAATKE
jgi:hypothetical protein